MPLGNPTLPLNKSTKDVVDLINETLAKKHWHNFEIANVKLILVPHYFFHYHYFVEKESEKDKLIESSFSGRLLINAENLSTLEGEELEELLHNIGNATIDEPNIEYEVIHPLIDEEEELEAIKIKSAEHFKVPKQNIIISHRKKIFVPYFVTFIKVKEGTFKVEMNACTGRVKGIEKVPRRERGYIEITKETLNDLKNPKAWLEYSVGLAKETKNFFSEKNKESENESLVTDPKLAKFIRSILESKTILLIIIFLALLMIYFSLSQLKLI